MSEHDESRVPPGLMLERAEGPLVRPLSREAPELDHRNATLLVDEQRKAFLAFLPPGVANSYAVLYADFGRWVRFCHQRYADGGDKKWLRMAEVFESFAEWLDRNLILSGATNGRRAQQLVQAITNERGSKAGPDMFFQVGGGQPKEQKKDNGWFGPRR